MKNNIFFYSLLSSFLLLSSCQKEDNYTHMELDYWQNRHTTFLGLFDQVKKVTETESDQTGETGNTSILEFNKQGNILSYCPTVIESSPSTRWIPFDMATYSYQYNSTGALISLEKAEPGCETIVYTLTYGSHQTYIPLPFPLANIPFFLVKGLESVTSNQGLDYRFANGQISYAEHSFFGTKEISYAFASNYPSTRTEVIKRGETLLETETTTYQFAPAGALQRIHKESFSAEEDLIVETEVLYSEQLLLSPTTERRTSVRDQEVITEQLTYSYFQNGRLNSIKKSLLENQNGHIVEVPIENAKESHIYAETDAKGNWLERESKKSSLINIGDVDGEIDYKRSIVYHKK